MNQQLAQVPAMFVGFEQPIAGAAGQYPFDRIQGGFRRGRSGVDEGAMHQRIEGVRMPERPSGSEEALSDGNGGAHIMQLYDAPRKCREQTDATSENHRSDTLGIDQDERGEMRRVGQMW